MLLFTHHLKDHFHVCSAEPHLNLSESICAETILSDGGKHITNIEGCILRLSVIINVGDA